MELVRFGNLRLKIPFLDSLNLEYHIMSRILPTDKQNVSNILCYKHFSPVSGACCQSISSLGARGNNLIARLHTFHKYALH